MLGHFGTICKGFWCVVLYSCTPEKIYLWSGVVLKKKGPHRRWGWVVGSPPRGKKSLPIFFFFENIKKTARVEPVTSRRKPVELYRLTSAFPQERGSSSSGSLEGSDEEDGEEHCVSGHHSTHDLSMTPLQAVAEPKLDLGPV